MVADENCFARALMLKHRPRTVLYHGRTCRSGVLSSILRHVPAATASREPESETRVPCPDATLGPLLLARKAVTRNDPLLVLVVIVLDAVTLSLSAPRGLLMDRRHPNPASQEYTRGSRNSLDHSLD